MGQSFLDTLNQNLGVYTIDQYVTFINAFKPFLFAMLTLFVVVYGLLLMQGELGSVGKEFIYKLLLFVLVSQIALSPDFYRAYIFIPLISFLNNSPSLALQASSVFRDGVDDIGQINTAFDQSMAQVKVGLSLIRLRISPFDVSMHLLWVAFAGLLGFVYVFYYFLLAFSTIALHIFLTFGAFALLSSPFKATQWFFSGWLRQVFTFALYPLFASIVMRLSLDPVRRVAVLVYDFSKTEQEVANLVNDSRVGATVLLLAFSLVLFYKVPDFVSSITGGLGTGTGLTEARGAAGKVISTVYRSKTLRKVGNWAAGKAGKLLGR